MSVTNHWGQVLEIGDVVGWGRRQGNYSSHDIGTILEFIPYDVLDYGYVEVKCKWVGRNATTTEASQVFRLDPATLSTEWQRDLREGK
jgi:hypothetical protein